MPLPMSCRPSVYCHLAMSCLLNSTSAPREALAEPVGEDLRHRFSRIAFGDTVDRQAEMIAVDMMQQLVARRREREHLGDIIEIDAAVGGVAEDRGRHA